jgi:hypothetical protein
MAEPGVGRTEERRPNPRSVRLILYLLESARAAGSSTDGGDDITNDADNLDP